MRGNILIFTPELSCTGTPESVANMARVIKKMGLGVTIYTLNDGSKTREIENIGAKIVCVNMNELMSERQHIRLQFDMSIVNTSMMAKYAVVLQEALPTILIIREAASILEFQEIFGTSMLDLYRVHNLFCVSEYAQEAIYEKTGLRPKVLYNYVPDYYVKRDVYHQICHKKNIEFGILGTIEERKGIDICIESFIELQKEYKNCKLNIIGRTLEWQSEYWKPLLDIVNKHENIMYHGEIVNKKEMLEVYRNLDIVIVASRDESCSLVVLEAAMMGKAIIVSENVGAKYLVHRNGFVFKTNDKKSLLFGMKKMIREQCLLPMKGKLSRYYYKKMASEKKYSKELRKIIERYIGSKENDY